MPGLKEVVESKRTIRDIAIEKAKSEVSPKVAIDETLNKYTRATASEIVQHIANRDEGWSATSVLEAYIQRTIAAQLAVNCVTEVMFAPALEEAKVLDDEFSSTGRLRGPLHGVPISLKDLFNVKGFDATIGFSQWANNPSEKDAEVVTFIRQAGGIPFVKTNVPQTMLSFECSNPLWGRSLNPHKTESTGKRDYTCGGSSGGEAALLALDGSALGLGTDIGGSLRIPAHFCGIYSIKPSPGRITGKAPSPGFEAVVAVQGPMGRSVEDIKLGCQVLYGKGHAHVPIPFRDEPGNFPPDKKFKFGYYLSDGFVKASPPCQRAVLESVAALRAAGHICVPFVPPDVTEAMRVFVSLTSADGYSELLSHLGPDPKEDSLFLVTLGPKLPSILRNIAAWFIEKVSGDPKFATVLRDARSRTVREFHKAVADRDAYVDMFEREVWEKYEFDGIIAPVSALPAFPHGASKTLSPVAVATILYNVVNSPVGVVPVTRVDPALDQITDEWKTKITDEGVTSSEIAGGHGSKLLETGIYEGSFTTPKVYDPEAMKGLPIGVQIIGRLYEDEKVVALMNVLDKALGGAKKRGFGPGSSEGRL